MTYLITDLIFFNTNDTDSLSTKSFILSTKQADESFTDLFWLLDKQIVLYSQDDMIKTDLFQKWWNLISYEIKFLFLKQNIKWEKKSIHKKSAWSHFIERANIIQEESRVIYKLCQKNLTYFLIKKSEIKAFWNHLNFKKCKNIIARFLSLQ